MNHAYKTCKRQTNATSSLPHCERFAHLYSKQLNHSASLEREGKKDHFRNDFSDIPQQDILPMMLRYTVILSSFFH